MGKLRHIKIGSWEENKQKTIGERSKLHAKRAHTHTPLNKTTGEEEEEDGKKERKKERKKKTKQNTSGPQS